MLFSTAHTIEVLKVCILILLISFKHDLKCGMKNLK